MAYQITQDFKTLGTEYNGSTDLKGLKPLSILHPGIESPDDHILRKKGGCKMFQKIRITMIYTIVWLYAVNLNASAQDIELPPPQKSGGMPLMEALNNRKSIRDFSNKDIPIQVLSDLLWAACGINRQQNNKIWITVPSAGNCQNISVYVAKADGLYLYDAANHRLKFILNEDIREKTSQHQSFENEVSVELVYVADLSILSSMLPGWDENIIKSLSSAHTGFIGQNVYLFCASFGLGTVVHTSPNSVALKTTMKLKAEQEIMLMQAIGYPAETTQVNMKDDYPDNYSLSQNYPNPFNPSTAIKYTLKESSDVTMKIYNLAGKEIEVLFKGFQTAGEYEIIWKPINLPSGLYFYRLQAGKFSTTNKLIYQK